MKLRLPLLSMVLAAAFAATACAGGKNAVKAEPVIGELHTLQGTLQLTGNEPHVQPMLFTSHHGQWLLQGGDQARLKTLQHRRIQVTGKVTNLRNEASVRPSAIQAESVELIE